ncbi:hypothetical protein BVC80_8431g2 [Macleaya cordata]|uniref:Uncharacterized protein n=1 Tax=Macleaya cordata TaxID=56857 RepID=A0A200Q7Z5_MACCD|nr:hypothetical protein BVC80_8431g2 [Macleaya cordata]
MSACWMRWLQIGFGEMSIGFKIYNFNLLSFVAVCGVCRRQRHVKWGRGTTIIWLYFGTNARFPLKGEAAELVTLQEHVSFPARHDIS